MAEPVRSKDWSQTPLGPVELWPQSLRTTVSLCFASKFPINIIWGADNIQIYNDGQPTVRMLVTDILEDLGCTAIEAADSAAGLRVLQSDVRIDLPVTDVGLPGGMNGRPMADAGRLVRPGLKVLFITGYAENAVLGNGHLEPGMAVPTKPFAMDTMAARIRSMIEAGNEERRQRAAVD